MVYTHSHTHAFISPQKICLQEAKEWENEKKNLNFIWNTIILYINSVKHHVHINNTGQDNIAYTCICVGAMCFPNNQKLWRWKCLLDEGKLREETTTIFKCETLFFVAFLHCGSPEKKQTEVNYEWRTIRTENSRFFFARNSTDESLLK